MPKLLSSSLLNSNNRKKSKNSIVEFCTSCSNCCNNKTSTAHKHKQQSRSTTTAATTSRGVIGWLVQIFVAIVYLFVHCSQHNLIDGFVRRQLTSDLPGRQQQQQQWEYLNQIVRPGSHVHILLPQTRIGPNGEIGYLQDPKWYKHHPSYPRKLQLQEGGCVPRGQGFEKQEGYQSLRKIRNHLESSTAPRNVSILCAIYTHAGKLSMVQIARFILAMVRPFWFQQTHFGPVKRPSTISTTTPLQSRHSNHFRKGTPAYGSGQKLLCLQEGPI